MQKIVLAIALAGLALSIVFAWQIGSCQVNNIELHDDLQFVGAQNAARIGMVALKSDEEVREEVIRRAAEHGLILKPDQVTVVRLDKPGFPQFDIVVDYNAHVNLFVYSFNIHYIQSNAK